MSRGYLNASPSEEMNDVRLVNLNLSGDTDYEVISNFIAYLLPLCINEEIRIVQHDNGLIMSVVSTHKDLSFVSLPAILFGKVL